MYPNQQQPGQVYQPQPQQPAQPAPAPAPSTYDFTMTGQPPSQPGAVPQPQQPQAPAFDPNAFKQEVINGVKEVLQGGQQPQQPQQPVPQPNDQPQYFNKNYESWGSLEQDTKKLVADVVQEQIGQLTQAQQEAQNQATQRDQQNQQAIDTTLNELRGAGFLPPVANKFDNNDPGLAAENELIGYAVTLGTTDLAKAAQELQFRHNAGFKFDYASKQFVQVGVQQPTGPSVFGTLPVSPDQPMPPSPMGYPQQPVPQAPMYPPAPVGPQNPYMAHQYPAGFNAPVNGGGGYMGPGMAGQVPTVGTYRHASYDQLVDMFNRTQ